VKSCLITRYTRIFIQVTELVALAELTQLQLGDAEREDKAHEALSVIYNTHLKGFLSNEIYIKKVNMSSETIIRTVTRINMTSNT